VTSPGGIHILKYSITSQLEVGAKRYELGDMTI
jgi:hypothetical protein